MEANTRATGMWKAHTPPAAPLYQRRVELRGHIIDSLTLSAALNDVLALGGDYYVEGLDIGHRKEDPSRVCLMVGAPTEEQLHAILVRLEQLGGDLAGCD